MKILYFDCNMGAAGDMLTAALLELLPDRQSFIDQMNNLGFAGMHFSAIPDVKFGIAGTNVTIELENEAVFDDVATLVSTLNIDEKIQKQIIDIYTIIAEAKSHVSSKPVTDIRPCEIISMDSLINITAVCLLIDKLRVDKIVTSPINIGDGRIRCANATLPVPAPATAHILREIPIYSGRIQGELCTTSGAAILKYFTGSFGDMPVILQNGIGYGMSKIDNDAVGCVRVFIGTTPDAPSSIAEFTCNVDDMTPEAIGYAIDLFMKEGALDAYAVNAVMKKGRPGHLITVMCREADKEKFIELILRHTTTLGMRENVSERHGLDRRLETVETQYGPVRKKISTGYGIYREKWEYEDLVKISRETGLSLEEIRKNLDKHNS